MKKLLIVSAVMAFSGCASSSGVVPTGPDSFMISRRGATAFSSTGALQTDAMKEGASYCADMKKQFQMGSFQTVPGGIGRFPQADIYFLCLDPGDPQLHRTNMRPAADQVIEVRHE